MVDEYLDNQPQTQEEQEEIETKQEASYDPVNYATAQKEESKEPAEIGIIRELSPKKVLEQLRMNLKGYFWDYELKKYVKVEGFTPLMNETGIGKYLSIVSSVITDLVTFSSYREDEINELVMYICDNAIPTIYVNYVDYGIQKKCDLPIITMQIFNLTLASFKKAVQGGDRSVIRNTIGESIVTRGIQGYGGIPYQRDRQTSFLSRLNPFK